MILAFFFPPPHSALPLCIILRFPLAPFATGLDAIPPFVQKTNLRIRCLACLHVPASQQNSAHLLVWVHPRFIGTRTRPNTLPKLYLHVLANSVHRVGCSILGCVTPYHHCISRLKRFRSTCTSYSRVHGERVAFFGFTVMHPPHPSPIRPPPVATTT